MRIYNNQLTLIIIKQIRVTQRLKVMLNLPSQNVTNQASNIQLLKWFGLGASAFTVGYLIYQKIIKNKGSKISKIIKETKKTVQKHDRPEIIKTQYSQFYFDKNYQAEIIQSKLGDPNHISLEQVYMHSTAIVRDQFLNFTKQTRHRRRLVRKFNQNQYIGIILNYQNQVEDLLNRSRMELIQFLKIDVEDFIAMEKGFDGQDLRDITNQAAISLRRYLITEKYPKKLYKTLLFKIMEDQIGFVRNKMYERLHHNLLKQVNLGQDKILKVVQALFEDIIYEKYGYQWQDIERAIQAQNLEKNAIVHERNKFVKKMEADVGEFNYQSLQSNQDQESNYQFKISLPTAQRSGISKDGIQNQ